MPFFSHKSTPCTCNRVLPLPVIVSVSPSFSAHYEDDETWLAVRQQILASILVTGNDSVPPPIPPLLLGVVSDGTDRPF